MLERCRFLVYNERKREVMTVFFKKKKKETISLVEEESQVYHYLKQFCEDGQIQGTAFVLPEYQLYIYADVLDSDDSMAQIVFQIHHDELEDAIVDPVCGLGLNEEECVMDACENFYQHDLKPLLSCLTREKTIQIIGRTQENHAFDFYHSELGSHGKREGELPETFWDWIGDGIQKRLGNKRLYWVKVYCAKMGRKNDIEVRINDVLSRELSKLLQDYVNGWDCLDSYHTEKQCFFFYQKDDTYVAPVFSKEETIELTKKAIVMFEKCKTTQDYKNLRVQLCKLCKDDSLGMELFGFIPELYCKHVFSDLEYGEQLFLIQKEKPTQDFYQTQIRSFSYIEETIRRHLKNDHVSQKNIEQIAQFSANYRAVQKAVDEGSEISELFTPGIGYIVKDDYILR